MLLAVAAGLALDPQAGTAYQFSTETQTACPACTSTSAGQARAAELAEALTVDGRQSTTLGSTVSLAEDAATASRSAGQGVATVATSLSRVSVTQALSASPLGTGGLVVQSFATGYMIGTAGRALVLELFGGDEEAAGASDASWSNLRWRLCTRETACLTTIYSSAWNDPVIPTGSVYAAWSDYWGGSTNVSASRTSGYTNCGSATPPNPPCKLVEFGSFGPQPGDIRGATAVTVYYVGTDERPGHVYTMAPEQLLDGGPDPAVVSAGSVPGPIWSQAGPADPRSTDDLLGALDAAISGNPGFGSWVNTQVSTNLPSGQDLSIDFPGAADKWIKHTDEFPELDDMYDYWERAVELVKAGRDKGNQDVWRCVRDVDDAEIVYNPLTNEFVIVKSDGIETFYKPDDGSQSYTRECRR